MKELTKKEIEEQSLDILHFLNLGIKKYNTSFSDQLEMILKMYKYVVQNIRPLNTLDQNSQYFGEATSSSGSDEEKKKFAFEKLRQALISNPGDTASNVILFNYLLYLKGYKSCIVLSESNNQRGQVHISSLVEVGKDDWYHFDPSLEKINFDEDQYGNPDEFSYTWAGLGNKHFSTFYRPLSTIREVGAKEIPISEYNIPEESILRELVESLGKRIPDLTYAVKPISIQMPKKEHEKSKEQEREK